MRARSCFGASQTCGISRGDSCTQAPPGRRGLRRRGETLVEILLACLMALFISSALLSLLRTTYYAKDEAMNQSAANNAARFDLDLLSDRLRNAQAMDISGTYQALSAGASSSVTVYPGTSTGGNPDTVKYYLSNGALTQVTTPGTGSATTSVLMNGLTALTFTYYVPTTSGAYLQSSSNWATTTNANAPTSAELPNVGAIQIVATENLNGYSRTTTAFVRLRNSPYKSTP